MKNSFLPALLAATLLCSCAQETKKPEDIAPMAVVPTASQIAYQQMEMVGFVHFTVNTFTDKEWGYGDEDPQVFNPTQLDAEQWAKTAKEGGLKELILTAKHHDGFCLWPSQYTEHSIKNSPYKNGKGDIVKEFVDACHKYGLKVGLYLSPWDRNSKVYGTPEYITYYRNQLTELLSNYGEINEIWFDGANGGDGYYGGAREERKIDRKTYYDWPNTFELVRKLQPNIKIFSDAGPDIHWIGNENGFAGSTFWSPIQTDSLTIGGGNAAYLNVGDPKGNKWIVGQCDVSIRPGWFYHQSQDTLVKTPKELVTIYNKSVGRNAVLLINLPPDQQGLIHPTDVANLKELHQYLQKTYGNDLAQNASITASNTRENAEYFAPSNLLDTIPTNYWAVDNGLQSADLVVDFGKPTTFNTVMLQEPIRFGQRIAKFEVQIPEGEAWTTIAEGTTMGYKKLVPIPEQHTDKVKIRILESLDTPALSHIGVYQAELPE